MGEVVVQPGDLGVVKDSVRCNNLQHHPRNDLTFL
jgi:hypothetical protein